MADPFIGEIRSVGFNFAPRDWAKCEGQLVQISQNTTLFSLIYNRYGGDGRVDFALPDLRGRCAVGKNTSHGYYVGTRSGIDMVTLSTNQMPSHSHDIMAYNTNNGDEKLPQNNVLATSGREKIYNTTGTPLAPMNSDVLGTTGGSQAHSNQMPFQALTYIIAMDGLYPPRS